MSLSQLVPIREIGGPCLWVCIMTNKISDTPWFKAYALETTWSSLDVIYLLRNRGIRYGAGEEAIGEQLGITSVGNAIEWINEYGDPKEKLEWVMWKRMIGSEIVDKLPEHLDPEAYAEARNLKIKKSLLARPSTPWRRAPVNKKPEMQLRWSLLDELYDWLQTSPPCTINKYGTVIGRGRKYAAHALGFKTYSCFQSMLDWISKNGNPRDNEDFLEFQSDFNNDNLGEDDDNRE